MSNPRVRLRTNYGAMLVELYPEKAPGTVANFLRYVDGGFYNETLFHRVIDGFVIQGGGILRGMMEKKNTDEPIQNEAANGLQNKKHTLAMARLPSPHSATSQFFININDNDSLNYTAPTDDGFGYCVFGALIEGGEVADAIGKAETESRAGYDNVPAHDIVIESAERADAETETDNAAG